MAFRDSLQRREKVKGFAEKLMEMTQRAWLGHYRVVFVPAGSEKRLRQFFAEFFFFELQFFTLLNFNFGIYLY